MKLGGKLLVGPMEVPGGDLVAQCLDPQGGAFVLHSSAPVGGSWLRPARTGGRLPVAESASQAVGCG
jgi:hypothetical protein